MSDVAVVALQGTRLKAKPGIPVEHFASEGFLCFSHGYTRHKAAGVMLCLNKSHFSARATTYINYGADTIAGRVLGIRSKSLRRDVFFCSVYLPPNTMQACNITKKVMSHLHSTCVNLPERCDPYFMGDFNAKFGLKKNHTTHLTHGLVFGCRQVENANGAHSNCRKRQPP